MALVLAGTGHRPDKIRIGSRNGYDTRVRAHLEEFAIKVLQYLEPSSVISGMALGWDQALARAATRLEIPWRAYVPFEGQESRWPIESQRLFHELLEHAQEVRIVCSGSYAAWKMQRRNEAMVDDANQVLALWSGTPGGTANCVEYAHSHGKRIIQCWPSWQRHIASLAA